MSFGTVAVLFPFVESQVPHITTDVRGKTRDSLLAAAQPYCWRLPARSEQASSEKCEPTRRRAGYLDRSQRRRLLQLPRKYRQ